MGVLVQIFASCPKEASLPPQSASFVSSVSRPRTAPIFRRGQVDNCEISFRWVSILFGDDFFFESDSGLCVWVRSINPSGGGSLQNQSSFHSSLALVKLEGVLGSSPGFLALSTLFRT